MDDSPRLPEWLRRPPASQQETHSLKRLLRKTKLNTVCEEARCPNITECFSRGTATFMILGDICTRGCRFCSVNTGRPVMDASEFNSEATRVADAAEELGLKHVVVTSVARDDLEDGGASGFAASILELRERLKDATVEVLIPDFRGNVDALKIVVDAAPDVLNHNLETVPRLYRRVRPGSVYQRSLDVLLDAKRLRPSLITKTGIMVGLGEQEEEVISLMKDCREHQIDSFTVGQYMRPTRNHLPVAEYVAPEIFKHYEKVALEMGFRYVASGPLVRSSYHAEEFVS